MEFFIPDHNEDAHSDWHCNFIRAAAYFPLDIRIRLGVLNIHEAGTLAGTSGVFATAAVGGGGTAGASVAAASPGILHVVHLELQ